MEPLPDLSFIEHSETFTPSEQAVIEKFKHDLHDHISQALSYWRQIFAGTASNTSQSFIKEFEAHFNPLEQVLIKLASTPLTSHRTKKELNSLQETINTTERLAFLIRY